MRDPYRLGLLYDPDKENRSREAARSSEGKFCCLQIEAGLLLLSDVGRRFQERREMPDRSAGPKACLQARIKE